MREINFKIGHMMMLYDEPKQSDQNYTQRCAKHLGHHQAKNDSFFFINVELVVLQLYFQA